MCVCVSEKKFTIAPATSLYRKGGLSYSHGKEIKENYITSNSRFESSDPYLLNDFPVKYMNLYFRKWKMIKIISFICYLKDGQNSEKKNLL